MSLPKVVQAVQKRVVVTGMGLLTPIGINVEETWNGLCSGQSGIRALTVQDDPDFKHLANSIGGRVPPHFQKDHWMQMIPFTKNLYNAFATSVASEAFAKSGWVPETEDQQYRTGITMGTGIGSISCALENQTRISKKGYADMDRLAILKVLTNLAAGGISMQFKLKGPTNTVSTACASGQSSIGDSFHIVQSGRADVMLAVASEHSVLPFVLAGFSKIGALNFDSSDPEAASRPFDSDRKGFVIGEGAGALVLEELEHALNRNAKIYAEIRGFGWNCDAEHLTRPNSSGEGAFRAMESAILQGGLTPDHIDHINAHATSTVDGDLAEAMAIGKLFKEKKPVVTSNKGNLGHLLGAAGAVEAVVTVLAVSNGLIPPTLNLKHPLSLPDATLNYATHLRRQTVEAALSNSFGFGGVNTSLLFTKYE